MQVCGICGGNHGPMDCDIVTIVSHIPDKIIPSKAKLTLPEDLMLTKMADNTYSVSAAYSIVKGTQFGPLQAKKLISLLPSISFPLRVFNKTEDISKDNTEDILKNEIEDIFSEYFLDTSNENECNWMMFVNPATDFQDQNVICYQDNEDIYFVTVKDICEGEILKVWYSPYYATKMQKHELKPVNVENNTNSDYNECIDTMVRKKKTITPRKIWSCKFCGKLEANLSEFTRHLIVHYQKKMKRYCEICNFGFSRIRGYQKHMKVVHAENFTNRPSVPKPNTLKKIDNNTDSLPKEVYFGGPLLLTNLLTDSMDNAGLNLSDLSGVENQSNLIDNESLNLNVESILPDSVKDLENFNFELTENENEQFVCDICVKSFRTLKLLITHMNIHIGKYPCFSCKKVFARKENLTNHCCNIFYKHPCSMCSKIFYQKKYLTNHMKKSHGPKKPKSHPSKSFSCTKCPEKFTHMNNLYIHLKAHQSPQEYTCPICNKMLHSRKTYLKHYKLHEEDGHKCEICEKVFNRKDTLRYHVETTHMAKLEICSICKKAVKTKKLLRAHMKQHEEIRSFKCSQCSEVFKQRHNMIRHMKSSHGDINKKIESFYSNLDKHYTCHKCSKKFKLAKSLTRHIKNYHTGEKIEHRFTNHEINNTSIESFCSNIDQQYTCDKCSKTFKTRNSIVRHIKIHHSEKKIEHEITNHEINPGIGSSCLNIDKENVCRKCSKQFKLFNSLIRHMKIHHPEEKIEYKRNPVHKPLQVDDSVMDLKQTIENMNFATDEINHEIDKLLNNPENFGSDSNDRMMEHLINTAVGETNLANNLEQRDTMLSMPNLDLDDII